MRRNKKQVTTYFILFSLLLIGVVYAILQANLQINGTAKIQANTWDVHFDNIQVNENSVSLTQDDSAATIDPENNCKVDFEVTLSIPGDFYEFTIDVVNAGTIDGMIGELNKTLKVNNETVEEVPDYLIYDVTYSDGVEIEQNHKITAGTTETYLVRLEFKTDIEELPQATTITTSLESQYLQADSTAFNKPRPLYSVILDEFSSGSNLVQEYTGNHKDSFNQTGNYKIYYWDNPSYTDYSIIQKNNIIFAGFCWQMYRTTDTGGVKLIYNGLPVDQKCNNTGVDSTIGSSVFNNNSNSLSYIGYMYNPANTILVSGVGPTSNSLFGSDASYENGVYTLIDTSSTYDNYHHYTCNNTTGICSSVLYFFYNNDHIELSGGKHVEDALVDMLSADDVNQTDSIMKSLLDNWFRDNLLNYSNKLEDTIFCNDRNIKQLGGWNPNGGSKTSYIRFDISRSTDLSCPNITDQFSIYNSKARLSYPIGLPTYSEINLINTAISAISVKYWLFTPFAYYMNYQSSYSIVIADGGTYSYISVKSSSAYVRPVVSLKPGTLYVSGDGSKNNPYIIE